MYLIEGNYIYEISDDLSTKKLIGNETIEIKDEEGNVTETKKFNLETGEWELI